MINFRRITEDNFNIIVHMKRPEGEHFVASNPYSLAEAWLYKDAGDVYPFAIYNDDTPVGFMMLDEDQEELSGDKKGKLCCLRASPFDIPASQLCNMPFLTPRFGVS